MADLLSTSIAGTLNVSQGATITSNLFVSNTDIVPEIAKYGRALTNVYYDHVKSWYPTNQVYDLGSLPTSSVSPAGIFVKPDGTQLYVLESTNDNVYQFRMTTAHNVASAIYEGNLRISTADTTPTDLFFSNTGTILYILGDGGNAIDAYDLTTAWNVVAGTTGANNIVAGNTLALYSATWEGMYMSPNGAFLYLSTDPSTTNAHIMQYNVATPWNVATSTLSFSLNVEPFGITAPSAVGMNKTGTKMYVIENGANYDIYVNEFNLSQPFQLVTASYSGRSQLWTTFSMEGSTPEVDPLGLFYDADSNTAYFTGTGDDFIRTAKTVSGTYIQNSMVVDGKITANNGLDVGGTSATTLGGALYVSGTTVFYSSMTVTGGVTLTGGTLSFSGTNYTFGTSTANTVYDIGTGATIANRIKSIRIGTGGVVGSNTDIIIGSASGGNTNVSITANTVYINNRDIITAIDAAANTARVSQNSGSTLSAKQLNFVNTANVTITVTDSGDGNANIAIFSASGGGGGAQGFQGVQGDIGAQGFQGFQGVQGAIGPQGFQGFQGVQGAIGPQGFQGFQGVQGSIGAQGFQGFQGVQGSAGGIGLRTIWIPAQTMVPQITNGAGTTTTETTTNDVMIKSYDFATATQEYVQFSIRMPKSWNEGTVTYEAAWTADSGTGGVTWSLQGVALSEADPLDTAWGTAVNVQDTLTVAGDLHISPISAAVTIAGTPVAGDVTFFRVSRVVADANDTLGVDARLIGVALFVTTDAQDDT